MTNQTEVKPLGLIKTVGLVLGAVIAFTLAYSVSWCGLLMFVFVYCLLMLAKLGTTRTAFYSGWAIAMLAYPFQLWFFYTIFGKAALLLWLIAAFWLMAFVLLARLCFANFKPTLAVILIPFLWTGLEYFRSELYGLRFSWLNIGYALPAPLNGFVGMYGIGFVVIAIVTVISCRRLLKRSLIEVLLILMLLLILWAMLLPAIATTKSRRPITVSVAGMQMEFPTESEVIHALNKLNGEFPQAQLFVLSEYTFHGLVPERVKTWCREHQRYLIVGGEDPAPGENYYNTAFVISTNGEVVFKQVKSVPIQFFKDGLPAPEQKLWNSPWGKIGICICYDLSYTRVTDQLIRLGAQALIVPTMDVADWGSRQHELHALVAPIRAAEYGIPIFRVTSSGISQFVDGGGRVIASAPFPGELATIQGNLILRYPGRLPLDRFLAPICVFVTAVVIVLLAFVSLRRKLQGRAKLT
jgi:apolipoprotein N-acyltransferase